MWIYILIAVIIIIAALILVAYHDTHTFVVRRYEMSSHKVPRDLTFAILSDLHGYVFGKDNEKLINAIRDVSPDYILCAGDMFTGSKTKGHIQTNAGLDLLKELAKEFKVYASNGNHEEKIKSFTQSHGNLFDRYKSKLVRGGVNYLENESVVIDSDNLRISGLELPLEYFQKVVKKTMEPGSIEDRLGPIPSGEKDRFQILIAHNPVYFGEYAAWGADLTVSGHVHGGIVRLPLLGGVISPSIALFPRFDGGKFEKDGKTMILSRGLGTHTIHVRIFNPCELAVVTVRSKV